MTLQMMKALKCNTVHRKWAVQGLGIYKEGV